MKPRRRDVLKGLAAAVGPKPGWKAAQAIVGQASSALPDPSPTFGGHFIDFHFTHDSFLKHGKATALAFDAFENALLERDAHTAASALDTLITNHWMLELTPGRPSLRQLVNDQSYLENTVAFAKQLREWGHTNDFTALADSAPEKIKEHISWLLQHPLYENIESYQNNEQTKFSNYLLPRVQKMFGDNIDLFENFDWESFFRENNHRWHVINFFSRQLKEHLPTDLIERWKKIQNTIELEGEQAEIDTTASRLWSALRKRGEAADPMPFSMQRILPPPLSGDCFYEIGVAADDPEKQKLQLGILRDHFFKTLGQQKFVSAAVTFDEARNRHFLVLQVDWEDAWELDQLCVKHKILELAEQSARRPIDRQENNLVNGVQASEL